MLAFVCWKRASVAKRMLGIAYPITGHWIWGDGWLSQLGFYDFAGSLVIIVTQVPTQNVPLSSQLSWDICRFIATQLSVVFNTEFSWQN